MANRFLIVGGLVAVGFDPTEAFLLVVSHSGRGVFRTTGWSRIARDYELAYPKNGRVVGIGPLQGQSVAVAELDLVTDNPLITQSPSGRIKLRCTSDAIEVIAA